MTSREDLIETAAETLQMAVALRHVKSFEDEARVVVDALLPQVDDVEQLEALPIGTVAVDAHGQSWTHRHHDWVAWTDAQGSLAAWSKGLNGPLTVVWQPEVAR